MLNPEHAIEAYISNPKQSIGSSVTAGRPHTMQGLPILLAKTLSIFNGARVWQKLTETLVLSGPCIIIRTGLWAPSHKEQY